MFDVEVSSDFADYVGGAGAGEAVGWAPVAANLEAGVPVEGFVRHSVPGIAILCVGHNGSHAPH